jgi:hypothetical protein
LHHPTKQVNNLEFPDWSFADSISRKPSFLHRCPTYTLRRGSPELAMRLTDRITTEADNPSPASLDPADILHDCLGSIFTDDARNQHGNPTDTIRYHSDKYGVINVRVADPDHHGERSLFAHYLWNAGIKMAVLIGGEDDRLHERSRNTAQILKSPGSLSQTSTAMQGLSKAWQWNIKAKKVLELGSGVQV